MKKLITLLVLGLIAPLSLFAANPSMQETTNIFNALSIWQTNAATGAITNKASTLPYSAFKFYPYGGSASFGGWSGNATLANLLGVRMFNVTNCFSVGMFGNIISNSVGSVIMGSGVIDNRDGFIGGGPNFGNVIIGAGNVHAGFHNVVIGGLSSHNSAVSVSTLIGEDSSIAALSDVCSILGGERNHLSGIGNIIIGSGITNYPVDNAIDLGFQTNKMVILPEQGLVHFISNDVINATIGLNGVFTIPVGAGAGKVFTSDANGVASWQPASGGSGIPTLDGIGTNTVFWSDVAGIHPAMNMQTRIGYDENDASVFTWAGGSLGLEYATVPINSGDANRNVAVIDENKKVQSAATYPQLPGVNFTVQSGDIDMTSAASTTILTIPDNGNYKFMLTGITIYSKLIDNVTGAPTYKFKIAGGDDLTVGSSVYGGQGRYTGVWDNSGFTDIPAAVAADQVQVEVTAPATADGMTCIFIIYGFYAVIP